MDEPEWRPPMLPETEEESYSEKAENRPSYPEPLHPDRFQIKAKRLVADHWNRIHHYEIEDGRENALTLDNVFIVWFSKTLQNWKAMVATDIPGDGMYYEVTYNGDRLEAYLDVYVKIVNECIPDEYDGVLTRHVTPDIPQFPNQ